MGNDVEMSGWMRWFAAAEGGRSKPHPGGSYAPTAYAVSETIDSLRSIAFDDVPAGPGIGLGEGAVYARWLNAVDLPFSCGPGTRLTVTEGPRPVAKVEIVATVPRIPRPWTFRVEQTFQITGRGVGVLGGFEGVMDRTGQPAELLSKTQLVVVPEVWLAFARIANGERIALFLRGMEKEQVAPGSLLRGLAL